MDKVLILRAEIDSLMAEIFELKAQVSELKTEVSELKRKLKKKEKVRLLYPKSETVKVSI